MAPKPLQNIFPNNHILRPLTAIVLLLLLFSAKSFAQQKITVKDAKDISYAATQAANNVPTLLNFIADPGSSPSDFSGAASDSYDPASSNRIFLSKTINIEDDIDPKAMLGDEGRDMTLDKYLNKLYVQYAKSTEPTIFFTNVVTSDIKKKDFLYVNVKFDSEFKGQNIVTKSGYNIKQRQLIVKVEYVNHKWQALINGISFYDPAKPITDTTNDVLLYSDTSATATVVSQAEFARDKDIFIQQKQDEQRKIDITYNEYIKDAADYVANKQFKDALDLYDKAQKLKTFVPDLDKKILDTKKLNEEYTYENFKNKGDKAKNERRFELAIQDYQIAAKLNPQASAAITALINPLNAHLIIIGPPKNKFESGLYQQAIDNCEELLKNFKKTKADYPELYYITAEADEALAAQKPDDNKSFVKDAAENYGTAIADFPNYLDARITRAAFLVKYQGDYADAISDYDVLITNALDDDPAKPGYYVTRAKYKDKVQNYISALDDYSKALALTQTIPSIYFDQGELQYRIGKFDDALLSFNTAIKLDAKYKNAYYYRGLDYVALKNNSSAGVDFAETEKLGYEPYQQEKVDSISNVFFMDGEASLAKHDFVKADTAYDNAIKIKKCNSQAWHGKAAIRLITAQELPKNSEAAKAKYLESVDLNTQATLCNHDFSDAYYKSGLAYTSIGMYDAAVKSYSEAIRSDGQNNTAFIGRGDTYQLMQQYGKAVDDYAAAVSILQANYAAAKKGSKDDVTKSLLFQLSAAQQLDGQALYNNKEYTIALSVLNEAIDNNGQNAEALYYRGLVYGQQSEFSKSFRDFNDAIKIAPDYRYYYANGAANYTDKNYDDAISNFTSAINADTGSVVKNRYYLRGMCYFKNKKADEAVRDFASYERGGLVKSDSNFYADYGLAKLYVNEDTSAIRYLNKALDLRLNDGMALYSLGCAYVKLGQMDKALGYFERAFATKQLVKDDVKPLENAFLDKLYDNKPVKTKYNGLKKQYLDN